VKRVCSDPFIIETFLATGKDNTRDTIWLFVFFVFLYKLSILNSLTIVIRMKIKMWLIILSKQRILAMLIAASYVPVAVSDGGDLGDIDDGDGATLGVGSEDNLKFCFVGSVKETWLMFSTRLHML
jgi:hypothetical protein